jgi:hypothetical protein
MRRLRPAFGSLLLALIACGGVALSPLTSEPRSVRQDPDARRTLTVVRPLTWPDASPPRNQLTLPAGTYTLEASDESYWYLRAAAPLELTEIRRAGRVEVRRLAGGIMLGKYAFRAVPAGAYIDGDSAATRILIWKLPGAFLAAEGSDWRRSF